MQTTKERLKEIFDRLLDHIDKNDHMQHAVDVNSISLTFNFKKKMHAMMEGGSPGTEKLCCTKDGCKPC